MQKPFYSKYESLLGLADQAMVSGTSFLSNILVLQLCGLEAFGKFSAWILVQIFVLAIQYATVTQPLQIIVGRLKHEQTAAYLSTALIIQLGLQLISAAAVLVYVRFNGHEVNLLIPFTVMLLCNTLLDTLRKILLANNRIIEAFIADFISCFLQLLIFAFWLIQSYKPELSAIFLVVGLTCVPAIFYALKQIAPAKISMLEWRVFSKMQWTEARWLLPGAIIQWMSANMLLVFAGLITNAAVLGILRLIQTVMGIFNIGLQALENTFLPKLSKALTQGFQVYKTQYNKLQQQIWKVALPLLLLCAISGPLIVYLGGNRVLQQHLLLIEASVLLYFIILVVYPIRFSVRLYANSKYYFKGYLWISVLNVLGGKFLVEHFQAYGVLLGWIISQLILLAYWKYVVNIQQKIQTHENYSYRFR